jgi:hypothetical protein
MRFNYRKVPDDTKPEGWALVPMLNVRLFYRGKHKDVRCLIDSGADDCLFHASIARSLGIDLANDRLKQYAGVDSRPFDAHVHTIELEIQNYHERITIEAGFAEDCNLSLLGQSGFFDNYEVTFRKYRGTFEIKSRTHIR